MRVVLDAAMDVLGHSRRPLLDRLAECDAVNLEWYLRSKIIEVEPQERADHGRVLKYALNFCLNAAVVTFLQDSSVEGVRTPDLKVESEGYLFYVEVKHFRGPGADTRDPASKIVYAVGKKKTQLPQSDIGFVAIDNFDLAVESGPEGGPTHDLIVEAFCELQRLAAENPGQWEKPSGVVIMTSSADGEAARRLEFPHLVWINQHSNPPIPVGLAQYLSSALPHGNIIDTDAECQQGHGM